MYTRKVAYILRVVDPDMHPTAPSQPLRAREMAVWRLIGTGTYRLTAGTSDRSLSQARRCAVQLPNSVSRSVTASFPFFLVSVSTRRILGSCALVGTLTAIPTRWKHVLYIGSQGERSAILRCHQQLAAYVIPQELVC